VSKGALASVLGSTAWVDVPRAVIIMAADNEDEETFHAQLVAGNRGPRGAGREYRLELVDVGLAEPVTWLSHIGDSSKDVEQLLAGQSKTSRSSQARELILDILENEGEQESDSFDARIARETGVTAKTSRNIRGELKDKGLIGARPDKNEDGTIANWRIYRTTAPREARALDKPEPVSQTHVSENGLNKPLPDQSPAHTQSGTGLLSSTKCPTLPVRALGNDLEPEGNDDIPL
jgi:hypothetical protein